MAVSQFFHQQNQKLPYIVNLNTQNDGHKYLRTHFSGYNLDRLIGFPLAISGLHAFPDEIHAYHPTLAPQF